SLPSRFLALPKRLKVPLDLPTCSLELPNVPEPPLALPSGFKSPPTPEIHSPLPPAPPEAKTSKPWAPSNSPFYSLEPSPKALNKPLAPLKRAPSPSRAQLALTSMPLAQSSTWQAPPSSPKEPPMHRYPSRPLSILLAPPSPPWVLPLSPSKAWVSPPPPWVPPTLPVVP
ncbi:unnamed protein product, partial [Ilex paraguariensis]